MLHTKDNGSIQPCPHNPSDDNKNEPVVQLSSDYEKRDLIILGGHYMIVNSKYRHSKQLVNSMHL